MRRLLFLIPLFLACIASAQTTQYLGAPTTTVLSRGPFGFANIDTSFTPVQRGIVVHRPADNSLYRSISTTTRPFWERIGAGSGSGGGGTVDSIVRVTDTLFIYTRDTVISIYYPETGGFLTNVTKANGQFTDTLYQCRGDVCEVVGYFDKPTGCETASAGGQVVWSGGLNFDISAAPFYHINCQRYTSDGGSVTLAAADATNGRYDVIAFDTSGQVVVIQGTPAENPSIPSFDPTLYWYRTAVFIPASGTEPQAISDEVIYNEAEAGEWARTTTGTITANFSSTAFAVQGTKSILVSARSNGSALRFTTEDTLSINNYQNLSFWLRLAASMTNQQNILVQFFLGTTPISNAVTATVNKNTTTGWQLVVADIGQFTFSSFLFDRVQILFSGNSSSSLYIDVVKLQTGITQGGGSPVPVQNAFVQATDGTNTATATGNGILKIRSANNMISVVVTDNDPTHGDNVLLTLNKANITDLQLTQITGLVDSLNKLQTKIEDVTWSNDTMYVKINGVNYFRYYNRAVYTNNFQGIGTDASPIDLNATPSASAPDSVLWMNNGVLLQSPAPTGGGGMDSVNITQPTDNRLIFAQMQGGSAFRTDTIDINHPVLDTANKWVNLVEKINDSTLRVWKYGVATDIEINGNGGAGGSSYWSLSGSDIHNNNAGKVGITATGTAPTFTGLLTVQATSLGATANSTNNNSGVVLQTGTAAALGAQQMSAPLTFYGNGWATTPSQSITVGYRNYLLPVQAAPAPTASLRWDAINSSGTPTNEMILAAGGNLTVTGNMTGNGGFFTTGLFLQGTGSNRIISFAAGGASPRALIGSDNVTGNLVFRGNGSNSLATGNLAMSIQNATGNVLINTATESNEALLKVDATATTYKGFLLTGMTQAQRDAMNLTVSSVTITNVGSGYTTNPSVTFSTPPYGGVTAGGTAVRTGNTVTSITITGAGSYNTTPTITISGGGGSGATATANMTQVLTAGLEIYCTDCTATDGSTGVKQVWNGSTWKNLW